MYKIHKMCNMAAFGSMLLAIALFYPCFTNERWR